LRLDTTWEGWDRRTRDAVDAAVAQARDALLHAQRPDGHWCYELEADCTIPSEYVLMMHYMDEVDAALQAKIAVYLRQRQAAHGGWALYHGGDFDVSCSVKAYYALKLAGDPIDAPHMTRARAAILAHGGAARANVFTRITLALFGQVPWRAVPFMPVELVLVPRWLPLHLGLISYWSRTVVVPLLILCSLKPRARNPQGIGISELFTIDPEKERDWFPARSRLNRLLIAIERVGRQVERFVPGFIRRRAVRTAEAWFVERLNGHGGLGAIFPAMVNAHEALALLGYPAEHPLRRTAKEALERLLVVREHDAYCQPCFPPVWDTAIAVLALVESGGAAAEVRHALDWLAARQLVDEPGDWRASRPHLTGGGWPFQYENGHYPDIDDTSMVAWAFLVAAEARGEPLRFASHRGAGDSLSAGGVTTPHEACLRRAIAWVRGMQSKNGGFGAFDVDNTRYYLNEIPFADHGALLDPPTADVSARCVAVLADMAAHDAHYRDALEACLRYVRGEQESCGAWFGRWGTNYIYGTWSVLAAFERAGVPASDPAVLRAVAWLKSVQRADGGWGESNQTYSAPEQAGRGGPSTSFQTAWAMLALSAAGEALCEAVRRGADYLVRTQRTDGTWHEEEFTAPGFPRVFYLKYHGYSQYFPLWALARYRNERRLGR
jgi:squalene-hopene/tetraprenyl-beta-curcumene cyclase